MPQWTWATRHAAWLNTRYAVRATGTTAYMEAFGTEYHGEICKWGETLMFQESASYTGVLVMNRRRRKADARYRKGIWVGRSEDTNEHICLTEDGAFLIRSVKRLPLEMQADKTLFLEAKGSP